MPCSAECLTRRAMIGAAVALTVVASFAAFAPHALAGGGPSALGLAPFATLTPHELQTLSLAPIASLPLRGPLESARDAATAAADAPLFGWVIHGRGAYQSDFVIDCDGRYFTEVGNHGGQRGARRSNGRSHSGIDVRIRSGDFICYGSDHEAKVIYVGFEGESAVVQDRDCGARAGRCVALERQLDDDRVESIFAHLKRVHVKPGQTLSRGDVIGIVGRSGRVTAPHLHYEKHINGRSVRLAPLERRVF